MKATPGQIQRIYLVLTLLNTLAASFIWGINTLFLLDAGLNNLEAFAANAFFTVGQVLFEVPTGVVADTWGRRASFMLGTVTLALSTVLYWWAWAVHGPFWVWAATSILLGLGFTFFSGATEAWLVDALHATGYTGPLDAVFAKGQMVGGAAMLLGSVTGGVVAQVTNLGTPYLLRGVVLLLTFGVAAVLMRDLGFTPVRGHSPLGDVKRVLDQSIEHGWRNPPVKWVMLAAPFTAGVGFYVFYAMQPFLLKLWGNEHAYGIAGLAAAIVAGAQIVGGMLVPQVRRLFARRTTVLIAGVAVNLVLLLAIGLATNFWVAVLLLVVWALVFAGVMPVRQAYLNGLIPSQQRATVLSFDSLMGSSGGVVVQPVLGRVADVSGYGASYLVGAAFQALALPFLVLARRQKAASDPVQSTAPAPEA